MKYVGVLLDRLEYLNLEIDTTLHLAKIGLRMGYEMHVISPDDVFVENECVYAITRQISDFHDGYPMFADASRNQLDMFDIILVRKDPPIDMKFTAFLTLLTLAENRIPMINSPKAILSLPEKVLPVTIRGLQPPTLISAAIKEIMQFKEKHGDVVLKPLYCYRGAGIYVSATNDLNFRAVVEQRIESNGLPIVLQKYISEVEKGDRRVILLGGEPIGAINRTAPKKDHRCNLFVGGRATIHRLTKREIKVCRRIGKWLVGHGLHFVGVDFIGGFVTEINTTSPTGITQIIQLGHPDPSHLFWQYAEQLSKKVIHISES